MSDSTRLRRQVYVILIVGAVAAVSGRIANLQQTKLRNIELSPTFSSNDRSRWATVRSLVDHHTYVIGRRSKDAATGQYEDTGIVFEDGWKTVDKVLDPEPAADAKGDVHYFYSSKPPLFPTIVAGEYWLLKQCGLSIVNDLPWVVRIILLTFNVIPLAIYLYILGRLADQYGSTDWGRLFMVFAAGFATFVTAFGNTLNNHTVATYLALFGLAAFVRIWSGTAAEPAAAALPPAAPAPPPEPRETAQNESPKPAEEARAAEAEKPETDPAPASTGTEPAATSLTAPAAEQKADAPVETAEQKEDEEQEQEEEEEVKEEEQAEVFTSFRMGEPGRAEAGPASSSSALPPVPAAGAGAFLAAGLFSGLAAALELPALAFTALAFLLLLMRDRGRTLRFFLPPVLLVLGLFLATNYLAIGRVVPAYAEAGADSPWYQYEGSHWRQDKPKSGIDFANEDKLTYALHFLIGHHGVFSLSPLFLLSLAGIAVILWRRRDFDPSLAALAFVTLILSVVVIAFYIYKTNNYGGFSSGPRWLMWLTPFWLVTLLPITDKLAGCKWGRGLALILLGLSILSASYPAWNPWQHPWIFRYLESLGWVKY